MVRAVVKLGRKTSSEDRGVISIKSEGAALKDLTLVGGIRPSYKSITADSLRTVISPKKVLERYPAHNRG